MKGWKYSKSLVEFDKFDRWRISKCIEYLKKADLPAYYVYNGVFYEFICETMEELKEIFKESKSK